MLSFQNKTLSLHIDLELDLKRSKQSPKGQGAPRLGPKEEGLYICMDSAPPGGHTILNDTVLVFDDCKCLINVSRCSASTVYKKTGVRTYIHNNNAAPPPSSYCWLL